MARLLIWCAAVVLWTAPLTFVATGALQPEAAHAAPKKVKSSKKKVRKRTKKKRKRTRRSRQLREGLYLRYGLGLGGCLSDGGVCGLTQDTTDVGFLDFALGLRFGVVGLDLNFWHNPLGSSNREGDSQAFGGGLNLRVQPFTKGAFDPFIGVGIGGVGVELHDGNENTAVGGAAPRFVAGLDYFVHRSFALGVEYNQYFLRTEDDGNSNLWTARATFTVYFDLSGSSNSRRKPRNKPRPKPRPKPKPKPKPKPRY